MTPASRERCARPPAVRKPLRSALVIPLSLCLVGAAAETGAERRANGFALDPAAIPAEEIRVGGPPRDGIPALDDPAVVPAARSSFTDEARVLGLVANGSARAYPLAILEWHELVNDTLGGRPVLVSYCPLCGTAMAFDRRSGDRALRFGVSGLLYRSDLLMFDRETESLWSQIRAEAVTGPALGLRLELLRSRIARLGSWRREHPDTTVLSRDTGHRRRYGVSPYEDYQRSDRLMFPAPRDRRYHPKMPTAGLRVPAGESRAYPAAEVVRSGGQVAERFAGRPVRVAFDPDTGAFAIEAPGELEVIEGYWFAWMAFHPESSVFVAPDVRDADAPREAEPAKQAERDR
ncbi:MAG: DUF3179 domain-containing protein [Deltaproteobacteria bacterium]|nr:MAG: DUF3179 domain-containing protein [Deltaproteobacteria bacterium]